MKKLRLNLACGNKLIGSDGEWETINIDNNRSVTGIVYRDIMRGLPFADGVADEVIGEHIIEHLGAEDFIFFFNEAHRVLKEGGLLKVKTPYFQGKWAFIDPTHKRLMMENSFDFFINCDYNSVTAGVIGWYEPVEIVVDGGELRATLKKVLEPKVSWNVQPKPNEGGVVNGSG